jgi:DNA-directed RNA polymerase subunit RPC12/RpoP
MSSNDTSVACANCGQSITDESPSGDPALRKPCPKCGSTAHALSASVTIRIVASITAHAEVVTYPRNLLNIARSLIDSGQYSIAVVVAHMACEIATERSLSEAFEQKGIKYLQDPIYEFLNGYNFANDRIRKLYSALTGDQIQLQTFWNKFKESASRRNNIVHGGATVGKAEAEDSFQAVSDLVAHIKK